MDPVLPPGPEWLRRRQLIEERKVADLERRLRAPSVRSLADLDDTAIDYLSEPPSDGDTLVFDESLGNDLSPAGRWRPGAGGGGGGEFSSIEIGGSKTWAEVLRSGASSPGLEMEMVTKWSGEWGIAVPVSGVYALTLNVGTGTGAEVQVEGPSWSLPGAGACITQRAGDGKPSGDPHWAPSVAAEFAMPEGEAAYALITVAAGWGYDWRMTAHLVHRQEFEPGSCG